MNIPAVITAGDSVTWRDDATRDVLGNAITTEVKHLKLLVVDLDRSEESSLGGIPSVLIRSLGGNDFHIGVYSSTQGALSFAQFLGALILGRTRSNRRAMIVSMYIGLAMALAIAASILAGALPAFDAGAHIDLRLGNGLSRSYSLVNPGETHRYVIAVQREVALQFGCGAWDAQAAMGGPGAMAVWQPIWKP